MIHVVFSGKFVEGKVRCIIAPICILMIHVVFCGTFVEGRAIVNRENYLGLIMVIK